ncbi:MAG: PIN domain-containing protein [Dehalococcoidia bacterium]
MPPPRVDANVVIRHLVSDPPHLARRARQLFRRVAADELSLTLEDTVIAEVVWVLTTVYKRPRFYIMTRLLELLDFPAMINTDKDAVEQALFLYGTRNLSFVDALIAAKTLADGGSELYSFDRGLDRVEGIRRLEP